jgi:hypothetical protein
MSEILTRSMQVLSTVINVDRGLSHPFDDARAKELLQALHLDGVTLDRSEVKSLALANGWPDRHAESFAELASRIGSGARVAIDHPRYWGAPTLAKIKAEIDTDEAQ